MAEQIVLIDDLDGKVIDTGKGGKVTLALNDQHYELDLSHSNFSQLQALLQPFLKVARKVEPSMVETDPEIARMHQLVAQRKANGDYPLVRAKEARTLLKHKGDTPNIKGTLKPEYWRKFRELTGLTDLDLRI